MVMFPRHASTIGSTELTEPNGRPMNACEMVGKIITFGASYLFSTPTLFLPPPLPLQRIHEPLCLLLIHSTLTSRDAFKCAPNLFRHLSRSTSHNNPRIPLGDRLPQHMGVVWLDDQVLDIRLRFSVSTESCVEMKLVSIRLLEMLPVVLEEVVLGSIPEAEKEVDFGACKGRIRKTIDDKRA